jgi:hypothetical protein
VCDQEVSKNEEAKAHYRAVKIQPQRVLTPGKQTTTSQLGQNIMALDILTGDLLKVQSLDFVLVCPSTDRSIVIQCLKTEYKK